MLGRLAPTLTRAAQRWKGPMERAERVTAAGGQANSDSYPLCKKEYGPFVNYVGTLRLLVVWLSERSEEIAGWNWLLSQRHRFYAPQPSVELGAGGASPKRET